MKIEDDDWGPVIPTRIFERQQEEVFDSLIRVGALPAELAEFADDATEAALVAHGVSVLLKAIEFFPDNCVREALAAAKVAQQLEDEDVDNDEDYDEADETLSPTGRKIEKKIFEAFAQRARAMYPATSKSPVKKTRKKAAP